MKLHALARLTLLGLIYVYTIRMVGTFSPGAFESIPVVGVIVGFNMLAGIVQVFFFVSLLKKKLLTEKPALRNAAWFAVIGSSIAMLPKFIAGAMLFQAPTLLYVVLYSGSISAWCPWLSSLLLFIFSLICYLYFDPVYYQPHRRSFLFGAVGWLVMTIAQSMVLVNYMASGRLVWLADLFKAGPILFIIASFISLVCLSLFYLDFARRPYTNAKQSMAAI